MRQVYIDSFIDLDDACISLENELDYFHREKDLIDIKGVIEEIDGKWRVSIISDSRQGELI